MTTGRKTGGRGKGTPNKVTAEIKAALQPHGDELVNGLLALTKSDDERVRLGAIQAALDRGWGRPAQSIDLGVAVPITVIERTIIDPRSSSTTTTRTTRGGPGRIRSAGSDLYFRPSVNPRFQEIPEIDTDGPSAV